MPDSSCRPCLPCMFSHSLHRSPSAASLLSGNRPSHSDEETPLIKGDRSEAASTQRRGFLQEEFLYVWDESSQILEHCFFSHEPLVSLRGSPLVLYNPVWIFSVLVCASFMLVGHTFHALLGQGGKVRDDETRLEFEVRVCYVYVYSGGFALAALMNIASISPAKDAHDRTAAHASLFGLFTSLYYLLGSWYLLWSMKTKRTLTMHATLVSRINFAAAVFIAFAFCLLTSTGLQALRNQYFDHPLDFIASLIRLFFCLCTLLVYVSDAPMLDLSYDAAPNGDSQCQSDKPQPNQVLHPRHGLESSFWTQAGKQRMLCLFVLVPMVITLLIALCTFMLGLRSRCFTLVSSAVLVLWAGVGTESKRTCTFSSSMVSLCATFLALLPYVLVVDLFRLEYLAYL